MQNCRRTRLGLIWLLAVGLLYSGCGPKSVNMTAATGMANFVDEANAQAAPQTSGDGSLYDGQQQFSNLFRDFKARQVNDVVTILVSETTQANSAADASNSKETSAKAGFSNLFGAEKKISELGTAIGGSSSTSYSGTGSTTRATAITTTVTARVKSVLPNGFLVIEGVRELRVNNENQTIYVTGIVRPADISARNVVPSGAIAQMEIRVHGKGVVSQPLKPGWLYRILNGILPF